MSLSEREQDTPPFGAKISDEFKARGWVSGDSLVDFIAQIKHQREHDAGRKRK